MTYKKIYHICNHSPIIIFRKPEDYISAINRLASCGYETQSEILAYCILSTHFHIIIRTSKIDEFISRYKRCISIKHNTVYNASIKLFISYRWLENHYNVKVALNYVIKNPIHHQISNTIFSHAYSSGTFYFANELIREDLFTGEKQLIKLIKASELTWRDSERMFGRTKLPDSYLIAGGTVVWPGSFLKVDYVENIYSSVRGFLYQMGLPLKEEIELFGEDIESTNKNLCQISLSGKLNDIQVCQIIDTEIYPRTYTQIRDNEVTSLWEKVRRLGGSRAQFSRAIGRRSE